MSVSRVIEVSFGGGSIAYAKVDTAYFYNNGILFKPTDLDLPASYQVHWADSPQASSTLETIGTAEGAPIPDDLWNRSRVIYGWIYLHPTEDSGVTAYEVRIYKNVRAGLPDGTEPTPAEQSTIDQLISALNTAVAKTAQDVISADQSARSASGDADRAERARTGAETAQGKAEDAQESAERAKDDAETSERNASESERNAKGYAETASEKADAITGLTAQATTLPAGSSASASYDAQTGVMSFGIPKGRDGTDGDDGYSPTANVSKSGKTATITITDKNGTTSAQVEDGTDGIDGISPSVSVTDITDGHRVVITDKDGTKSFDVEDGATGATPNLTIGTVETLEPTDDATATITGTAENPVLNFGIPKGEQGEVTLEDYYKAFPTDTASGAIASFTDGADDLPLKSLVVNINPVQDLHGQVSPYPAGGGKNVFPPPTSISPSSTTMIANNNGVLAISSTGAGQSGIHIPSFTFAESGQKIELLNSFTSAVIRFCYQGEQVDYFSLSSANRVIPEASITSLQGKTIDEYRIQLNGATSGTLAVMVTPSADSALSAFSPYENICPISGWTSVDVQRTGVNVWDEEWEVGGINNQTGEPTTHADRIRSKNFCSCRPSTSYYGYITGNISGFANYVWFYDANKEFISGRSATKVAFTTPSNAYYFKISTYGGGYVAYNHDISINYPSTDHSYHPYTGRSITINLGQTVYGGKLDVLTGELTIDRAIDTYNGGEAWSFTSSVTAYTDRVIRVSDSYSTGRGNLPIAANYLSSKIDNTEPWSGYVNNNGVLLVFFPKGTFADATEWKAYLAENPLSVVYPLATPIEIQLSPNQVNSLLGVNNLWADSGDTEVEYRADTKLFIERLTAPDSEDMVADANITSGQYFMVGNSLYKATANIANGAQIIVGTNCIRKSLSEALNEINA